MNTFERCLLAMAAAAPLLAPVCAQTVERRATFAGSGGNDTGKCTIEVYVEGSADVEIRGDRGFLQTRSGRTAQWRRFVCSGPLPTNPSDFRFSGVDGRGRQELIQDPRSSRGAAVVRIQDPNGGAEGYTFDLEWRGGSYDPGRTGQPDRGVFPNNSVRECQDAVRVRAKQQYGIEDIAFASLDGENNPGRSDTILGSFDVRRGEYRETYRFSCGVNRANGIVQGVDIVQERLDATTSDRWAGGYDATSACQRAAMQRIQQDGYRNVQFGWLNTDNRQNDRIAGTATAQRGNNGRAYDFDVRCSVNPDNGNIRSMEVNRR